MHASRFMYQQLRELFFLSRSCPLPLPSKCITPKFSSLIRFLHVVVLCLRALFTLLHLVMLAYLPFQSLVHLAQRLYNVIHPFGSAFGLCLMLDSNCLPPHWLSSSAQYPTQRRCRACDRYPLRPRCRLPVMSDKNMIVRSSRRQSSINKTPLVLAGVIDSIMMCPLTCDELPQLNPSGTRRRPLNVILSHRHNSSR